ncbi:MAG TPA: hypothetical protein PKZ28_08925, partial [Piscinibacter sp.]|nr:hypothetical protein [Piscinibacter sp.]
MIGRQHEGLDACGHRCAHRLGNHDGGRRRCGFLCGEDGRGHRLGLDRRDGRRGFGSAFFATLAARAITAAATAAAAFALLALGTLAGGLAFGADSGLRHRFARAGFGAHAAFGLDGFADIQLVRALGSARLVTIAATAAATTTAA